MVYKNKKAKARIESAKIIFVDEASMLSGNLFDMINFILKRVKNTREEFGGIQVVLIGDFLQLPPIFKDLNNNKLLFESNAYNKGMFRFCALNKIIRQKDDNDFAKLLNEIRFGDISNIWKIKERIGAKLDLPEDFQPVRLLGYNKSVDEYNQKCLESIEGDLKSFRSIDYGESHHIDSFDRNSPVGQFVKIKKGAQVSLCWNVSVEEGFVNGSVGVVTGFASDGSPIVKFKTGKLIIEPQTWEIFEQVVIQDVIKYKSVASRTQIPLRLAFASSIHRAQGQTLDFATIDLEQVFTESQAYVALSRVKSLNGISILRDFDESRIKVNKKCVDFYLKNSKLI
jgi:ATP-dependent DNA helicase PIF1